MWSFKLDRHGRALLAHRDLPTQYRVKLELFVGELDTPGFKPEVVARNAHLIPK